MRWLNYSEQNRLKEESNVIAVSTEYTQITNLQICINKWWLLAALITKKCTIWTGEIGVDGSSTLV